MARQQVRPIRRGVIMQKFYVYDPSVHAGDELGGLRVREEDDDKFVLAPPMSMQYWIDSGLAGDKPLGEISDKQKLLLAQVTRGRSESDDEPKRLPKYSKQMQSGAPSFALTRSRSASKRAKARNKQQDKNKKKGPSKPKNEPPKTFLGSTPAE